MNIDTRLKKWEQEIGKLPFAEGSTPFGIHLETGEIIDVSKAKRGLKCNCVCLSCEASLIARQGEVNLWHFSHADKPMHPAKRKCDNSFWPPLKTFSIEQLNNHLFDSLELPEYSKNIAGEKLTVTTKMTHKNVKASSSKTSDLTLTLESGHEIAVLFSYPNRDLNTASFRDTSKAVIIVDLRYVLYLFGELKEKNNWISVAVIKLFNEHLAETSCWGFHPRELKPATVQYLEPDCSSVQNKPLYRGVKPTHESLESSMSNQIVSGVLQCASCGKNWKGTELSPRRCPKCRCLASFEANGHVDLKFTLESFRKIGQLNSIKKISTYSLNEALLLAKQEPGLIFTSLKFNAKNNLLLTFSIKNIDESGNYENKFDCAGDKFFNTNFDGWGGEFNFSYEEFMREINDLHPNSRFFRYNGAGLGGSHAEYFCYELLANFIVVEDLNNPDSILQSDKYGKENFVRFTISAFQRLGIC